MSDQLQPSKEGLWKKHKKLWILLIAAAAAVCAGLIVYRVKSSSSASNTTQLKTEALEKRTIVNSVSGTGTVVSVSNEEVSNDDETGIDVASVSVEVGDVVSAGDEICRLDTTDLEDQKADLQDQITQLRSDQAERHQDYDDTRSDNEADRQKNIASTQQKLNEAQQEYETAQSDLADAQSQYQALLNSGVSASSATAMQYEGVIEQKKSNVEVKRQTVVSYQEQLDALNDQSDTTEDEDDALKDYDDSTDDSVEQLQDQIDDLQDRIDKAVLRASIPGTVTAVNVRQGDTYNGGSVAEIEGVDVLQIEAYVDEYDVADVAVGQSAVIKTDSTRDEELQGTVTFVAPKATDDASATISSLTGLSGVDMSSISGSSSGTSLGTSSDSASYLVRISLDEENDRLRLGMNARISIVTEEADNVWAVPIEAVSQNDDGQSYITIVTDLSDTSEQDSKKSEEKMKTKRIDVTTGLEGTYYVEVTSDQLKKGLKVIIPDSASDQSVDEVLKMIGKAGGA